jgi:hypothetical protein
METESNWQPKLIDLSQVEGAFSFEEGFSRPNWKLISQTIKHRLLGSDDLQAAWVEAATQWVNQVRFDLGGDYRVKQSRQFILLSAQSGETNEKLLNFAERTLDQICKRLGDAAWTDGLGKHVILLFEEQDDYYEYISYFHRDGTHPTSGGCLLGGGYVHIAAPFEPLTIRRMLAHELTHNCVAHLRLPLWLNEGLAATFERLVSVEQRPVLDAELKLQHLGFWNEENIQEFWSGISWSKPGDPNHLSYSLAEIMIILLSERRGDLGAFLKQARRNDAGQTASLDCLGVDLGDLMATFLGEGKWRPRRKAMADLWAAWRNAGTPAEPESNADIRDETVEDSRVIEGLAMDSSNKGKQTE